MSDLVKLRVKNFQARTAEEEKLVLRAIIQEIALLALSRSHFFEHAAFYGGTALRILYGLNRFSENLDFTLLRKDPSFSVEKYTSAIARELTAFNFEVEVQNKVKTHCSPIESAFIKADSSVSFVVAASKFKPQKGSLIKVKIEIDTDAIPGFTTEAKQFFWPQPFSVLTCDPSSLMAGKIHATFCRGLRQNVKGRDWFDLLWYVGQGTKPNWSYVDEKMRDSGHWDNEFSEAGFKVWAAEQVSKLDIAAAKRDVERFIKNPSSLDAWSHDLFIEAIKRL